jgi:hypothetical protein
MAVAGVGSGVVLDDARGFQEGVDGVVQVGMGVHDEGSQAGINEGDQSGMGVTLPELEGAEHRPIWVSIWS